MLRKFPALLILLTGLAHAKSGLPEHLPQELKENLICAFSQKSKDATIRKIDLKPHTGRGEVINIGSKHRNQAASWNLEKNYPQLRSESITISFDLHGIDVAQDCTLISVYTPDCSFDNGLRIYPEERGRLAVSCHNFAQCQEISGDARIPLGRITELIGKTITVVYHGSGRSLSAYIDGEKIPISVTLTPKPGTYPTQYIHGIVLGNNLGGYRDANSFQIDNLYIWNKALTDSEVAQIPNRVVKRLQLSKGKKKKKKKR